MSFLDLFNCPSRVFTDRWFFVVQDFLQHGEGVRVTGISQCNYDVAQVAASSRALDGSPLEALIKSLGCESQLLGQGTRRGFFVKDSITFARESIPRADHLADIAAENPIPNLFTELRRDVILEFNGEIGNTAPRIDGAIRKDAIGGAGVYAASACAAMIGDEGRVRFEIEIEKNFG